ncbi:FAD/NAD(P)-binding protein [Jeotgalibaca caeni]|uniref:FAD/NAD(P)-binding protein n=1 Tax=Jeotgalibaca caeni TaxID=3028623 RepID=UPI00237DA225|nr:FAD/NAD(P)-binding protein [Jeotgalibaca caeni]MDE1549106.1 FAD/NAD(P)-binding protein [Jeotgalibaca caeni]
MKIAIIGMGVAGVSVLQAIAERKAYEGNEVVLYDTPQTFGTGLPYQPDTSVLLLNQAAETMSMNSNDSDEFARWVEREKGVQRAGSEHVPRAWFGQYMREHLARAMELVEPTVVKERVIQMQVENDGRLEVKTASQADTFDIVHLCTGHLPYKDPYQLIGHPHYIHHPYPAQEKLKEIPNGARVGIIGSGLSAIDMMRFFDHHRKNIQLHFVSETGTFSTLRGEEPKISLQYVTKERLEEEKQGGFVPLTKILEWFKLECSEKKVDWKRLVKQFGQGTKEQLENQLLDERDLGIFQAILHEMDSILPDFWLALTEMDKQTFMSRYQTLFETFRSPLPRSTTAELIAHWQKGEIRVHSGMKSVTTSATGFSVSFEAEEEVEVDYLLNATGQMKEVAISTYQDDLINHGLNTRLFQPEAFGGIQVIWPDSTVVSQRYGVIANLYAHGQLIHGLQFGNNTAGMIRDHAYQVVEQMMKRKKG